VIDAPRMPAKRCCDHLPSGSMLRITIAMRRAGPTK